jgi:hypothetical protein
MYIIGVSACVFVGISIDSLIHKKGYCFTIDGNKLL